MKFGLRIAPITNKTDFRFPFNYTVDSESNFSCWGSSLIEFS